MFGDIIGYIVIGAIIGALARLALPGKQSIGWAATIIIGIAGAFLGGMIMSALTDDDHSIISFIVSLIVAVIGVGIYAGMQAKKVGASLPDKITGNSGTAR